MSAVQVFYSGKVQGVGFRATVKGVARGYDVQGRVRNLPDGRVELIAFGEEEELQAFLLGINESVLKGHIKDSVIHRIEVPAGISGFEISG